MDKMRITGIPPYDGEYDFDGSYFTNRELHTIKRISGVRGGEIDQALDAGDSDVIVAMAVITLERAGKNPDENTIWDAKAGGISLILAEDGDALPPDSSGTPTEPSADSGDGSALSTGPSPSVPSPTGTPPLDTGFASLLETSAT